ncbi:RraA-like protein [Testicularia cyperi]|uniref:RraA-like protein n=1 Tax=Testicularia cyperi TaxID=1882483 RepID=A0A317XGQ7_9BASI|nr:RraA-like protein [Testicularia cyperi]
MPLEGAKLCGPAYTVRMVAGTDDGAPRPKGHFVDEAEGHSGHVMVVSAPIGTKSAVWGGLMTARAQQLGLVGAVLDANVRDLSEHRQSLFPVFARGHSTLGQSPFTRPSEYQIPLTIHVRSTAAHHQDEDAKTNPRFPNITIHPGDIVLADLDGVVIIPPSLALDVIRIAEKGKAQDALCLKDIQNGMPVKQAFAKNRTK